MFYRYKDQSRQSIQVCGKAVVRGGGLVWKYHVFTFLMVLGNTWIYLSNYQTLATTQQYERRMILVQLAVSKQSQRGRRLRAMTAGKSKGSKMCVTGGRNFIKGLYLAQESNTGRKTDCSKSNMSRYFIPFFFFFSPVKICHYLNRVQCLQLSHNCDNKNRQCADNQCPQSGVDNI